MPAQYEAIRDQLIGQGVAEDLAKTIAARVYNAHRPRGAKPVTGRDRPAPEGRAPRGLYVEHPAGVLPSRRSGRKS